MADLKVSVMTAALCFRGSLSVCFSFCARARCCTTEAPARNSEYATIVLLNSSRHETARLLCWGGARGAYKLGPGELYAFSWRKSYNSRSLSFSPLLSNCGMHLLIYFVLRRCSRIINFLHLLAWSEFIIQLWNIKLLRWSQRCVDSSGALIGFFFSRRALNWLFPFITIIFSSTVCTSRFTCRKS